MRGTPVRAGRGEGPCSLSFTRPFSFSPSYHLRVYPPAACVGDITAECCNYLTRMRGAEGTHVGPAALPGLHVHARASPETVRALLMVLTQVLSFLKGSNNAK